MAGGCEVSRLQRSAAGERSIEAVREVAPKGVLIAGDGAGDPKPAGPD